MGLTSNADQDQDTGQDQAADSADILAASADTPISADLKQRLSAQVDKQISYENAASADTPAQAALLTDLPQIINSHPLFVVDQAMTVFTPDQANCYLGPGDIITLVSTSNPATGALVDVNASRTQECPSGTEVYVSLNDLQEMQNSFRAELNSGLLTLRNEQGSNGVPSAPPSALATAPSLDPNIAPAGDFNTARAEIQAAQAQASVSEAEVAKNN
ncbi:MAG: hypothetical protein WBY53_06975 [Acidobacteriaceae bacterium]